MKTDFKLSNEKSHRLSFVSQDSLDELEMDDFWKELENISHSAGGGGRGEGGGETQEEEQQKIPEGRRHGHQAASLRPLKNPHFIKYVL